MENKIYEIFILNPKKSMILNMQRTIKQYDFQEIKAYKDNYVWKYKKENEYIELALANDSIGPYISITCEGISNDSLRESMSICPECKSINFEIFILYSWRNCLTEQLYKEGRINYGSGAYDRPGTRSETHKCLECGCKWHSSTHMFYWNEVINQNRVLTKEDLGLI